MRCMLVDDEPLARERLARLLHAQDDVEIVGQASNGEEALELAEQLRPELMFVDVAMPGMDGFELVTHLNTLSNAPAVIFCTAYDEHALEAFEAKAIDYLVKPVKADRLAQALEQAHQYANRDLADARRMSHNGRRHICARVRGNLELIPIEDVIFFHAEHKYITVRHVGGEVLIEEALTSLERDLSEHFIRIHRNALVDRSRITGLVRQADGQCQIKLADCKDRLDVSRRNLPQVRKILKEGKLG